MPSPTRTSTFPLHTLETAPEESRATMINTERKFGAVPRAVALLATSPHLLNGFVGASQAFEHTTLPPVAREVVVMTVAVRNGCQTCIGIHGAALRRLGHAELIAPLQRQDPLDDPDLGAVQMFVRQLLDHAGAVDDEQLQEFLDAGFTRQHALEVVFGIGTYTMSTLANRLVGA